MKLIVVPEAHRQAAEVVVRAALVEQGAGDEFALTLIRLPGSSEWRVHASGIYGRDESLAALVTRKLREAGL